jgi:hypothetical protein
VNIQPGGKGRRPFPHVGVDRAATVDDDGVVHFMEVDVTPAGHGAKMHIAAFDLKSEEWKAAVIYGPPVTCRGATGTRDVASELKGALSVVQNVGLGRNIYAYINIWFDAAHKHGRKLFRL